MRAISLWQPWASAIALGLKQIETRHWWTDYRGPLAVHAAKRWGPDERDTACLFARRFDQRLAAPPLGAIIATACIVDCVRTERLHPSEQEDAFGNFAPGRFGWILRDVVALADPIPFKGAQGFFDVPGELLGIAPTPALQGVFL